MAYLEVRELGKNWAGITAVDNINFDLHHNQFIALLGPSGCGKSTTLNMVAGLEVPSTGHILLDGIDISHKSPGERGLSMVFQSYALFPHLSAAENITFGLKARRVPVAERKRRLKQVLELVNLGAVAHKKPGQLSGGQCQRVALARAIVSQAPLCLMDEPLSNLDAKLRNSMRGEIRALQQELGLAVLYVTHDQIEAMSMADEIILLNQGRIEQQGPPQELYEQPQTVFAAEFIGSPPMNLLASEHDDYWLGLRTTQININPTGNGHAARVVASDYHGADTLIFLDLDGQPLQISSAGHRQCRVGETLYVDWRPEYEHYFRRDSGKRCIPPHRFPPLKNRGTSVC